MTDSPPLPPPSWPSSSAILCLIAQRSVAFWPLWISQVSRRGARCFKRISSREPLRPFPQAGCGIVWGTTGSSSMSMAPNKPRANEHFHRLQNFLLPIDALTRSALRHIWGANEEKWHAPAPPCSKPTHTTGWAPSGALGMGTIVANGDAHLRPSSVMRAGSVCLCPRLWSAWMGCMAMLQSSKIRCSLAWGSSCASRDYGLLDLPAVQARLRQAPDQQTTHPESGASRALFDCLDIPLMPAGPRVRLIVATHATTCSKKPSIGVLRAGIVYELFLTTVPPHAFTPADVLDLYLHRGSFETVLADEDREQDPDRWCSHTACGQEFWQILNQWIWNLRLELGQHLSASPMRLTEFALAHVVEAAPASEPAPVVEAAPANEPAHVVDAAPANEPAHVVEAAPANEPAHVVEAAPASEPVLYGPPQ